ncbi:MAG: zinc-binding dehydrogenase, partial [Rubrobacter sp.]|nr:zinc-binding dehydrogenase [Rubrobacter sp.]
KAIVLHELNGPDALSYEDRPEPKPGPGEALVKLKAAALNRRDVFVTQGQYPGAKPEALPVILGSDGSGELVGIGNDVEGIIEGTPPVNSDVVIHPSLYWGDSLRVPGKDYRILGLPENGTYAQYVKVPAENVFRKPAHLLHEEAAAIPLAALTAYRALVTRGGVQEGETVLIPGIGGGVATFLVQMATALGARVFVTSSDDEKIESAKRDLGAEGGVNYNSDGWQKELRSLAGGIDLSVDSIGGDVFDALATLANTGGRIVSFGATRGPVPKMVMPKIFLKQLDVLGTAMGSAQEFDEMLKLYEDRGLKPKIDSTHPLQEASTAQKRMEAGDNFGKIVLSIPE